MTLERARHLMEIRRHGQALTELSAHLAAVPDDVDGLCLVAVCHLELGDLRAADQAASAALRRDPSQEWPLRIRSIALGRLGRHQEALELAREAVAVEPSEPHAHIQLSQALARRGRLREADRAARRAVELAPHDSQAHLAVAIVADKRLRRRTERAALEHALRLDPHNVEALNNLAALNVNQGRLEGGTRDLVAALRTDPQHRMLHDNLDAVGVSLLARLVQVLLLGSLGIAAFLAVETSGPGTSWWPRALGGSALVALALVISWRTIRHVPTGPRRRLWHLPLRVRGRGLFVLALFVLAATATLWISFAPADVAGLALLVHAGLLAVGQLLFVWWVLAGVTRWVRAQL